MDLRTYVEGIHQQLDAVADVGGDELRTIVERLVTPLDAAIRLALQDALAAAAEEITCELAPGSVEVRLRGRDPEFVVTRPPLEPLDDGCRGDPAEQSAVGGVAGRYDSDDGTMSRINLRLSDQLKGRVEQAAARDGLSVNSWLVRAASSALERRDPPPRPDSRPTSGAQRFKGWAR